MNIRFLLAFILMIIESICIPSVSANQPAPTKEDNLNEIKTISIIKSKKQFLFKEIIISVVKDTDTPFHIVFNMIIARERTPSFTSQENDIPLIIDTLLSKLLPTLNLFHKEITSNSPVLNHSSTPPLCTFTASAWA